MTEIVWRKASRSKEDGSNCIEMAEFPGAVVIRDSKDPDGPKIFVSRDDFQYLVEVLKSS